MSLLSSIIASLTIHIVGTSGCLCSQILLLSRKNCCSAGWGLETLLLLAIFFQGLTSAATHIRGSLNWIKSLVLLRTSCLLRLWRQLRLLKSKLLLLLLD